MVSGRLGNASLLNANDGKIDAAKVCTTIRTLDASASRNVLRQSSL
jgi:hypothetical protein